MVGTVVRVRILKTRLDAKNRVDRRRKVIARPACSRVRSKDQYVFWILARPPVWVLKANFEPFRRAGSGLVAGLWSGALDLDGDARCERVTCETSNRLVKAVGSLTGGA